ncbi:MAG: ABC transporter substrate-binding protein [Leptolyngbyaceae cyanobacterium CSU_1_3]|nr:ABC transporter substrate-binding protein [Leptolyngbyaceae cyanobacterium CSU_1_3]
MAFSLLLMTACYQPVIQKTHLFLKPSPECRVVQHEFGETCVPLNPRWIVVLSPQVTLDPLVALDIKPIGFTTSYIPNKEKKALLVSLLIGFWERRVLAMNINPLSKNFNAQTRSDPNVL